MEKLYYVNGENSVLELMFIKRLEVINAVNQIKYLKFNYNSKSELLTVSVLYNEYEFSIFNLLPFEIVELEHSDVTGKNFYIESLMRYRHNLEVNEGLNLDELKFFVGNIKSCP